MEPMDGRLVIRTATTGGVHTFALVGELDYSTAPGFTAAFRRSAPRGQDVDLDLADVPFADSVGLAALLEARKTVVESGGQLRLSAVDPQLDRTLQITGLNRLFG